MADDRPRPSQPRTARSGAARSRTTPERLVDAAARLFQQNGYAQTGIAEILASSGVPKGSLYHHFPGGKEDLALAAADRAGRSLVRLTDRVAAAGRPPAALIAEICAALADVFETSEGWRGCPVTLTLLAGRPSDRFTKRARSIYDDWAGTIAVHLAEAGLSDDEAAKLARRSLVVLQGAWVLARAEESGAPLRDAAAIILPPDGAPHADELGGD